MVSSVGSAYIVRLNLRHMTSAMLRVAMPTLALCPIASANLSPRCVTNASKASPLATSRGAVDDAASTEYAHVYKQATAYNLRASFASFGASLKTGHPGKRHSMKIYGEDL